MSTQAEVPDSAVLPSPPAQVPDEITQLAMTIRATWPDGTALPAERRLAEELGVKRHTLRRALQYLREEQQIAPPRARARKPRPRPDDLVSMTNPLEVAELRRMIEPVFAKLAAMRATPSDIDAMQKELAGTGRNGGRDLHQLIAQATGNALAAEIYSLLRRIEDDNRLGAASARPEASENLDRQRAVVDAIAAREPDKAREAMSDALKAIYLPTLYGIE